MIKRTIYVLAVLMCASFAFVPNAAAQNYSIAISVSGADCSSGVERFKLGDNVQIKVQVTNTSDKKINIPKGDDWNRPQLLLNGQLVPYRKDIAERIKKQIEMEGTYNVTGFMFPESNETKGDAIDLSYWYEPLEVGQYQLSLERLFFKLERTYSNTVLFEVVSAKAKSSHA